VLFLADERRLRTGIALAGYNSLAAFFEHRFGLTIVTLQGSCRIVRVSAVGFRRAGPSEDRKIVGRGWWLVDLCVANTRLRFGPPE